MARKKGLLDQAINFALSPMGGYALGGILGYLYYYDAMTMVSKTLKNDMVADILVGDKAKFLQVGAGLIPFALGFFKVKLHPYVTFGLYMLGGFFLGGLVKDLATSFLVKKTTESAPVVKETTTPVSGGGGSTTSTFTM